jgi:hypothetical protein
MAQTYPVPAPINGINQDLFPFKVESKNLFKQYLKETPLKSLMGMELNRPIVIHKMQSGDGFQFRVPKLNALDYTNPVMGFNQVSGQGQTQKVDVDYVTCDAYSFPVYIQGQDLLSVGTPISLPTHVNGQIKDACRLNLNKSLLDVVTTSNYAVATQKPSYDRVILAGLTPTRATYNGYAGIQAALDTMTGGITYTTNGMSADLLQNLRILAAKGGKTNGAVMFNGVTIEDQIQPAYIKTKAGWPMMKYIYFAAPEALKPLYLDPMFSQATTTRGTISDSNQPELISGADFVGEFQGTYIYSVDDLSRYTVTSADGNKVASWGFLIGAAAWSLGWYKQPWLAYKQDTIDMQEIWTSHEIRGQKCLKFAAKQASTVTAGNANVEQGIVHTFVRIS